MKTILAILATVLLVGCVQSIPLDPYGRQAFKPLFDQAAGESTEILFQSKFALLETSQFLDPAGYFIITKNTIYIIKWDYNNYCYNIMYKCNMDSIRAARLVVVQKGMFNTDVEYIELETPSGRDHILLPEGLKAALNVISERLAAKQG